MDNPADSLSSVEKDTTEVSSSTTQNVFQDNQANHELAGDTSFQIFFNEFTTDSVFQREHVQFPFLREWSDTDNDTGPDKFNREYVQKETWKFYNFYYDKSFATRGLDAYTQKTKVESDYAVIEIRGVDNGIWIDYNFEKKSNKWMLISEKDSSN